MSALDATDRHIIRLLRLNARISNAKLASEVGLSPSACLRRVDILEREGVIRGYTAITGSAAGGEVISVIVQITLDRQTEDFLNRFENAVRRYPEVRECYLMTGGSDYFLRVESKRQAISSGSTRIFSPSFRASHASIRASPSAMRSPPPSRVRRSANLDRQGSSGRPPAVKMMNRPVTMTDLEVAACGQSTLEIVFGQADGIRQR